MENIKNALLDGKIKKAILDTDTFNEIDDQFCLTYMLQATDKVDLLSVNAAPFFNPLSSSPKDGMEKSYLEIAKILKMCKKDKPYFRGSEDYLKDEKTPQISDAAKNIVNTANSMNGETLYVVAIGAITNVASALLLDPSIKDKIVIIWLGGHALHINSTNEFNMVQDIAAARVVFESGAPLVMVPCIGMCDALTTSLPELEKWVDGKNEVLSYLTENVRNCYTEEPYFRTRVIWDVAAAAVLINPEALYIDIKDKPEVTYDGVYKEGSGQKMIYVSHLWRDKVFKDLFDRLLTY